MKLVYLTPTVSLLCSSQEEIKTKFFDKGFTIKQTENKVQYLIKEL